MANEFILMAKMLVKKVIRRAKWLGGRLVAPVRNRFGSPRTGFVPPHDLSELAPLVKVMAQTGQGTDACLEMDCLPMLVHYYSPIPDLKDLAGRDVWSRVSSLPGIEFRPRQQVQFLLELGARFGMECHWPLHETRYPYQFYLDNKSFSYGCAASLHCMIRHLRPRRVVEVGSGHSSRVISAAIGYNLKENPGADADYTIVDPYPDEPSLSGLPHLSHMEKQRVELLDPTVFGKLEKNDILFVDTGHTVRIGGDVNYLILEILPNLTPGVVIHFHDIPMPYEYPKAYATSPTFRTFWTESYLLQAFLSYNHGFEVLLAMNFLMSDHMDRFREAFPLFEVKDNWAMSGSFWIRRVASS